MNIQEIQEYHKHRFPFLLVDGIDEIEAGKYVRGHKCFSNNEWLFNCSINENSFVPFTLLIEILSQVLLMPVLVLDDNKGKLVSFLSVDDARIYKQVYPGDCMDIVASVDSWKRGIAVGTAKGYVNEEIVCEAKLKFALPHTLNQFKPEVH